MSVYQRTDHTWRYDFRHHGERHTAGGFPSAQFAKDAETVVRARLLDQRMAREYGIGRPRGRIPTLDNFLEQDYLPGFAARVAPATLTKHRADLRRLATYLGMHRICDIDVPMLERYRTERGVQLQANSLRSEWMHVRQFFRAAVEAGYLRTNPAAKVGLPAATRGPDRILSEEEQERFLTAFHVQTMRDMAEFSLWTALRPGELVNLRGRHVDIRGARLIVPQSKVHERAKIIPLMPEASAILLRQPPATHDEPIFRSVFRGKPVRPTVYRRAFHRAVEKAGIEPIRPHDLRHTCAVRLIRAGADLPTIGDILGHKPPYLTTARYIAHTSEARKREVLSRLRFTPDSPKPKS